MSLDPQRLDACLEVSTEGYWDWDLKADQAYLSPRYLELIGEVPVGTRFDSRFFSSLIHPEDRDSVFQIIQEHLNGLREKSIVEYRMVRPDGNIIWIEGRGKIIEQDEKGQPARMVGVIIDITDRKIAEKDLLAYKNIVSSTEDYFSLVDPDYKYRIVNDAYLNLLGKTRQEIIGHTVAEVLGERIFVDTIKAHLDRCLSGELVKFQFWHDHPQSGQNFMDATYTPLVENGVVKGVAIAGRDITQIKLAKESIRKSDMRHRTILQTALDGIWLVDAQGHFLEVNQSYCKMSGYSEQELLTMSIHDVENLESPAETTARINQFLKEGKTLFISQHRRKDGSVFDVEVSAQYRSEDDEQFVVFIKDITSHLQTVRALEKKEEQYRLLFQNQPSGFALHEIILDLENKPCDYRFIEVNPAFETLTGFSARKLVGNTVLELMPDTEPSWIETYGQVALTGEPISFENFSVALNKYFQINAYSPEPGKFATIFYDITDRKKTELELNKLQNLYAEAEIAGMVGGWEFDISSSELTWTEQVYQIHEVESKTFKPTLETSINYYAPSSRPIIEKAVRRAIEFGEPFDLELDILTGKGVTKSVHTIGRRQNENQTIIGFIQDITDRKQIERAHGRLLAHQRAILDNLPMMAWLKDTESRLEMVNEPYAKACGHSVEECIGKTDMDLFPHEMAKEYIADDRLVCSTGQKKQLEEKIATPDGEKWHQTFKTPIFDDQKRVIGTAGIAQDITARKQAEISIITTNQLLQTIIDSVPMRIFWKDTELRYLGCNFNFAQDAGVMHPSDLIGKDDFQLGWKEQAERYRDDDRQVIESGVSKISFEEPQTTPGGHQIWLRTSKVPLRNEKNNIIGVLGIYEDITGWKQAWEEKAQLELQLQQAQKMESIGHLAGGVAHDFNNMLGVIIGHVELALMKAQPTSPIISDLKDIQSAAQRSADLTRQLLTFARKQIISPKVLDLNHTVAGMLKMLQRLIGENIHLSWNPATNLWPVKIDPSQLDQILANLCVNARDAIDGIGKITIESRNNSVSESRQKSSPDTLPGDYVRLSVSDDGHGIDKDILPQIFEPFFTTKEFGQGTGLGLSMVFGAIKQNEGFIEVSSEPGQGTTFHIFLPRQQTSATQYPGAAELPLHRGTETVLLVEDDQMLLDLVKTMLQISGYTVLPASTIDLAISLAKEHSEQIHLLISDLIMPEMNGRELWDILQVIRPEMKVIFMSGYTADIIAKQGIIEEGIEFLQKPVSFNTLLSKVGEVLDANP